MQTLKIIMFYCHSTGVYLFISIKFTIGHWTQFIENLSYLGQQITSLYVFYGFFTETDKITRRGQHEKSIHRRSKWTNIL